MKTTSKLTDDYVPKYDPIDNPYNPKKPKRKSVKPQPDVSQYDPVNHPFTPKQTFRPNHGIISPAPSSKNNPLVQTLTFFALLIPFFVLVAVILGPVKDTFRDLRDLNEYLVARPGLSEQELVDLLNKFFENRRKGSSL